MRITYDHHEFLRGTGTIFDLVRVKKLGLSTDDICAAFSPYEVDDLLDFCAQNPQFHIVTYLGDDIYINRYDIKGSVFQLADGDSDPAYILDARPYLDWVLPLKPDKSA